MSMTASLSSSSGNFSEFPANVIIVRNGEQRATADNSVLLYFDAGDHPSVLVAAISAGATGATEASVTLTGYILDCSIAPCAAIAH
jgi:hypothetical protein